jgi:cytochrome P450
MTAIAAPLYCLFPVLETLWPRSAVHRDITSLKRLFETIISDARAGKGEGRHGMLSLLVTHEDLSDDEIRDNLITFFMAGHDTTAATLCSVAYYLAIHPDVQARAREEVRNALGDRDPKETADLRDTPFVLACIREALRLNPPLVCGVPRACAMDSRIGDYVVPAKTSLVFNLWAIQHSASEWEDPFEFRPERYLDDGKEKIKMAEAWRRFFSPLLFWRSY